MSHAFELEEFDLVGGSLPDPSHPAPVPEEERLEVFEQGYKAGWDDAANAQAQDHAKITADLEGNLRDLAFTFHEARAHVLQGVEPLIRELVTTVFPSFAADGLPHLVAERLANAVAENANRPISLTVSPGSRSAIEAILPVDPGFPLTIREEPSLGDGQVFLTLGAQEEVLDIDEAISSVQSAIRDFFELNERQVVNG